MTPYEKAKSIQEYLQSATALPAYSRSRNVAAPPDLAWTCTPDEIAAIQRGLRTTTLLTNWTLRIVGSVAIFSHTAARAQETKLASCQRQVLQALLRGETDAVTHPLSKGDRHQMYIWADSWGCRAESQASGSDRSKRPIRVLRTSRAAKKLRAEKKKSAEAVATLPAPQAVPATPATQAQVDSPAELQASIEAGELPHTTRPLLRQERARMHALAGALGLAHRTVRGSREGRCVMVIGGNRDEREAPSTEHYDCHDALYNPSSDQGTAAPDA